MCDFFLPLFCFRDVFVRIGFGNRSFFRAPRTRRPSTRWPTAINHFALLRNFVYFADIRMSRLLFMVDMIMRSKYSNFIASGNVNTGILREYKIIILVYILVFHIIDMNSGNEKGLE